MIRRFFSAAMGFLVGDEPLGAAVAVAAVLLAVLAVHLGANPWPVVPVGALLALGFSVVRTARR